MNGGDGGGLAGVLHGVLPVSSFGHASCLLPDLIQEAIYSKFRQHIQPKTYCGQE